MPYSWIKMYLMKKKNNKIRNYSYRQTNKRFVQRSKRYTNRQVQTNRQTDRQMYTCPKDRTKQTETQSTDKRRINIDLSLTAHSAWMLRSCYRFRGGGVRQTARHTQTIKQISTDFCQIDESESAASFWVCSILMSAPKADAHSVTRDLDNSNYNEFTTWHS